MNEGEEQETDRPFECELCGRHFSTRKQMKDLVWEYHEMGGDIPPKLPHCHLVEVGKQGIPPDGIGNR